MHEFGIIFLVFFTLHILVKLWLNFRHLAFVKSNRDTVPQAFREKISLQEHQKAADYTTAKGRFGRLAILFEGVLLLIWTFGGGIDLLDQAWRSLELSSIWTGIAVILSMLLITGLLDLPMSAYSTFVIEQRFGFNRTTLKTFMLDLVKGGVLAIVIGVPLLWVVLWLMEQAGEQWWLYTWVVWTGFSLFLAWAYPTFIAPLFNKFQPLSEGPHSTAYATC